MIYAMRSTEAPARRRIVTSPGTGIERQTTHGPVVAGPQGLCFMAIRIRTEECLSNEK